MLYELYTTYYIPKHVSMFLTYSRKYRYDLHKGPRDRRDGPGANAHKQKRSTAFYMHTLIHLLRSLIVLPPYFLLSVSLFFFAYIIILVFFCFSFLIAATADN